MALSVKEDETADPVNVSLLGANAVMLPPDAFPHLVQELRLFWLDLRCNIGLHFQPMGVNALLRKKLWISLRERTENITLIRRPNSIKGRKVKRQLGVLL